jgi:hypothetical protein
MSIVVASNVNWGSSLFDSMFSFKYKSWSLLENHWEANIRTTQQQPEKDSWNLEVFTEIFKVKKIGEIVKAKSVWALNPGQPLQIDVEMRLQILF